MFSNSIDCGLKMSAADSHWLLRMCLERSDVLVLSNALKVQRIALGTLDSCSNLYLRSITIS